MMLASNLEACQSPSLRWHSARAAAYELKFLLGEAEARALEAWARACLALDPHGDPALDGAYRTTSLYCDTPDFDVFHRRGACKRRKHRLRRYDLAPCVFLERKSKWGDRVKKRRSVVPGDELTLLAGPLSATTWEGHWFHRHLQARQLSPVCRIGYDRIAFVGQAPDGTLRVTLDRNVRGVPCQDWSLAAVDQGMPHLTEQVICELKYQGCLPTLFKEIIQAMRLTPTPVSKYRTFLKTLGHVAE
jgi:hypothetical protein